MLPLALQLAQAATLDVPAVYPTITDALDAAVAGDEIVVAGGTYCEDIRCISGYVLQDQVTTRQIVGAGKTYDAGAFECETSFHLCEPVDLGALVRHDNSVAMSLRQDESSLSHYHGQSDFLGGRELIRRWLDEPCMQFGGSQAGHHPDDAAVFAHVSLWYP